MTDDAQEFRAARVRSAAALGADPAVREANLRLTTLADRHDFPYLWDWLGVPIIQTPTDIVVLQEIVWSTRPQVIIETGVARGGSMILAASLLELIGEGVVIGVDIDIRPHNRRAVEAHPLAHRVRLVEGSSVEDATVARVRETAGAAERVMVILDSDHRAEHVEREIELYAPLVTLGQYLVVADTIVELIPAQAHRPRRWGPGDNPMTAVDRLLARTDDFESDAGIDAKLMLGSSPRGYLRRVR